MARVEARMGWRHEVCDPPDFTGISAWPELRAAAVGTHSAYQPWLVQVSRPVTENRIFEWPEAEPPRGGARRELVRDAVHDAAASLGVPVSEMDAVAHVIPVEGQWSYIAGPGCGVCSDAVALDPAAASDLLRRLFMSAFPGGAG
jgi:hypothetical protein